MFILKMSIFKMGERCLFWAIQRGMGELSTHEDFYLQTLCGKEAFWEVTETLSVQSPACLPYQIVITLLHLKNVNGGSLLSSQDKIRFRVRIFIDCVKVRSFLDNIFGLSGLLWPSLLFLFYTNKATKIGPKNLILSESSKTEFVQGCLYQACT